MLRDFGNYYYPTLIIRPDEMRGLHELPSLEKDNIFPIFQLCPWVGSGSFEKTFEKIQDVYSNRPAIVDLDRSFYNWSDRDSVQYFRGLLYGENRADDWISLISRNSNYIPCVQHEGFTREEIEQQVEAFIELGRGIVFKFRPKNLGNTEAVISVLSEVYERIGPTTLLVIVDLELIENASISLNQAMRYLDVVSNFDNLRVVLTSASFPSDFSFVDGVEAVDIQSRQIFAQIRSRYNQVLLSYSDWGSTKPRKPGFGAPLKRIDYPMSNQWVLARSKTEGWDYMDAASELVSSRYWVEPPKIWGVQMIELAARADQYAINTRPKSSAARINIHLFVQNHYGENVGLIPTDEPWTD